MTFIPSPVGTLTFIITGYSSYFPQPAAMMKLRRYVTNVLAASGCALTMCNAVAQESCKLTAAGTAKAAAARDGRTLVLEDGREVRLAAIEAGDDSRDALQTLIGGQVLRLERQGAELDRYGRMLAFAYAGDAQQSVQQLCSPKAARGSRRVAAAMPAPTRC
jgi:endonuclease YncB( thermonuclease family)